MKNSHLEKSKRNQQIRELLASGKSQAEIAKEFGIPADQQSKVFSKFFRADNAVSQNIDGTGLGLYIVKNLVEKIGGKIWFKSPVCAKTSAATKKLFKARRFMSFYILAFALNLSVTPKILD